MADPKTNRALGQTSNRSDVDADEDPLVELARIVSEDGGFSGPRAEKPRVTRNDPPVRDALADGLEAELLQELESSFAARETPPAKPRAPIPAPRSNATPAQSRPAPAPVAQRPTAAPAPVRPRAAEDDADPDELLRSIEEQLSQFERRQAGRFASTPATFSPEPIEPESANGADAAEEPNELPFGAPDSAAEARDEWQGRRASRIRPFAEVPETLDEIPEPAPEPSMEEPLRPQAPRSEYRFRGPASAGWDRPSPALQEDPVAPQVEDRQRRDEPASFEDDEPESLPFGPAELAAAAQAPIREPSHGNGIRRPRAEAQESSDSLRRDRLNATFPEFDEEPPEERAAPDLTGIEAELSRELEPRFAAVASGDKWQDGDEAANEPRVAAAIAPGASRRAAAARAAAQQRGRSRLGLFATAVILVVVAGGAAAFYLRGSESAPSGPPPVITADEGAVRIEPAQGQQASEGETVGDAVYNRVAGNTPPTDEHVVDNSEEPKEVARIVLPQSQSNSTETVVRPVGGDGDASVSADANLPAEGDIAPATDAEPAPSVASNESEIGPRRVPTFVVKADGSIVATSDAGAPVPDPTAAQDQQLTGETEPIKPVPVPTVAIAQANAPGAPPPPAPPASSAQAGEEMGTRPTIDEPPAEVAASEPAATPPPVPAAEAPADTNAASDQVALAAAEPAAPPPATTAGGGYSVQLSSEGSMADAQSAFARAQQKFPTVLGKLDPQIQQADLGAKGIFYRVRVGPWAARKDAVDLCEALKAAGGNCFVAK